MFFKKAQQIAKQSEPKIDTNLAELNTIPEPKEPEVYTDPIEEIKEAVNPIESEVLEESKDTEDSEILALKEAIKAKEEEIKQRKAKEAEELKRLAYKPNVSQNDPINNSILALQQSILEVNNRLVSIESMLFRLGVI